MPFSFQFESMGTVWKISIWQSFDFSFGEKLKRKITSEAQIFDETYSRFKRDSFTSKLSRKTGIQKVPHDFVQMLNLYIKLYHLSAGKFTPLVGTTLADMGYDEDYSLVKKAHLHPVPKLTKIIHILDSTHIQIDAPVLFDFGAIGKGYFVDKIKNILLVENVKQFLVDGSGDIYYQGDKPIRAGLEHPADPTKVIGIAEMFGGAMCASGSNRRSWGDYHHIIDPDSLTSPKEIIATWVTADTTALADGLATALFLSPPNLFENAFRFEYLLLNKDMRVKRSKGFDVELL